MAITKVKLKQLEDAVTVGSIVSTDTSKVQKYIAPPASSILWGYDHGETATVPVTIGTNLSYDAGTNTLNATAGAGGYATIQEETTDLTARTKMAFIGSGLTAADDSGGARTTITLNTFLNTLATAGAVTLSGTDVTGTLPVNKGGTGAATLTGLLQGNGTSAVSAIADSSVTAQVLRVTGASTYAWGALNIASSAAVTGTLAVSNGGTGLTSYTIGSILYASGATTIAQLADVAVGQVLKSGGTGVAPAYGTLASSELSDTTNIALLSGTQTFSGTKTFTNNVTINGTPSANTDAATVGYVQTFLQGLDPKASVIAATTTNGTLATAFANGQVIDGITLSTGNRILIKNQSTTADNGIYTVNASGAPTRATDMDAWTEVPSTFLFVEKGTVNADTGWVCNSDQGGTLGTTAITFVRFASNVSNISGSGSPNTVAYWSAVDTLTYNSNFQFNGTQLSLNTAPVSSTFTTLGAGNTNSTFGYKHLSSAVSEVFSITDNGTLKVTTSGTSTNTTISPGSISTNTNLTISSTSQIAINPAAGTDVSIGNGGGGIFRVAQGNNYTTTTGTLLASEITPTFVNGAGNTATFSSFEVRPNITQTGGATGITRGISIAPTLTNAFDFRGLEITATSAHYALYTVSGKVRFDLGSDATGDMYYRDASGNFVRLATGATSGHVLTSNGSAAAPSWQAASGSGSTITTGYVTGSGTTVYDLDAGIVVTDVDGTAFSFTVPTNLDKVFVYRNGMLLSRSGTVSRDYTLVSATGVLTLASVLATDEVLTITKIV